jgi:hypothetical protein
MLSRFSPSHSPELSSFMDCSGCRASFRFSTPALTTPMTADLAFNTAVSFATTTTWQAYPGETTMSYWSQLVALTTQNFLAGAAGLAVGLAFKIPGPVPWADRGAAHWLTRVSSS